MANPDLMTALGAALSIFLTAAGSVVASIQAGLFALRSGGRGFWSFAPIIISGVLAIYGIIIAVLLSKKEVKTEQEGYQNFAAGLSVGLACLMSGIGMAKFIEKHMENPPRSTRNGQVEPLISSNGDAVVVMDPPTVGFMFVLVFLEAIGLYGLIVALILQGP